MREPLSDPDPDLDPPPSFRPRDPAALPDLPGPEAIRALPLDEVQRLLDIAYNPAALAAVGFALDAGLFEACRAPVRAAEVAARLADRASEVSLEMTAELCAGLGLVARRGEILEVTPMARRFLLGGSPLRLTGLLRRHQHYLRAGLGSLGASIAGARRAAPRMWTAESSRAEQDEHFTMRQPFNEASIVYFADTALLIFLAHRGLDLGGHRVACDIGAGPGAFAGLLQRCHPGLRARAVDVSLAFPRYRQRAAAWLEGQGCAVELLGLNALHDPLPPGNDLVTVNRLITGVPKGGVERWLRRVFEATAPGGRAAFADYFFTGDPAHDLNVTSLYVHWGISDWLAHEEIGRDGAPSDRDPRVGWGWLSRWTCAELADALRAAGFVDVRARPALSPFAVVEGVRP